MFNRRGSLIVAVACAPFALPAAAWANPGDSVHVSFASAGQHAFPIPAGVRSLHVVAIGGRGGDSYNNLSPAPGGAGARVEGDLTVTPSTTVYVEVGGNATAIGTEVGAPTGGLNGGGDAQDTGCGSGAAGGGGGASDIRTLPLGDPGTLGSRLLVAGGGGGSGSTGQSPGFGLAGGGPGGDAGADGTSGSGPFAGGGGLKGGGGVGGAGGTAGTTGIVPAGQGGPGGIANGGSGGTPFLTGCGGGGGGGYGGGGGGGGGSNPNGAPNSGGGGGGAGGGSTGGTMTLAPAIDVPSVSISYVPLSPTQVHVTFSAPTIYADGTSHTTAQVHVFDAADNPVDDATVSLASSDAGETIGPVTSEGNGTFDATITASGTVGAATITAHAVGETADATGTGTLTQKAGPASAVIVALAPNSIVADGTSTTTATVTLSDAKSRRVTGDPVVLTSSDSGQKIGALADNGDGTYTAVITSSKAVGTATITATDGSAFGMTILTQTAPPGGGQGPGTPSGKPKLTLPKSLKRSATALTISVSGLTAGSAVQVKLKLGRAALVASTRTATTSALTLKLRLSKKARTRLRRARHARKLTLSVSVTPPGASSTSLTGSLKLKP